MLLMTEAAVASALEWALTATKAGRLPPTPKGRKASCRWSGLWRKKRTGV